MLKKTLTTTSPIPENKGVGTTEKVETISPKVDTKVDVVDTKPSAATKPVDNGSKSDVDKSETDLFSIVLGGLVTAGLTYLGYKTIKGK